MSAADPTYPLYPVVCGAAAILMVIILSTNTLRRNWNPGVTFLCFWLFLECVVNTVNAIIWSDNADIKLYAWCDLSEFVLSVTSAWIHAC